MSFSQADYLLMLERLRRHESQAVPADAAERETGPDGLQAEIVAWCDAQWPRWVHDFPRTDLKSTLPLGRHDSTVWGPYPRCYLIETKAKAKKQSQDQLVWAARLKAIGWQVEVVYSLAQFLEVVNDQAEAEVPRRER